MLAPEVPVDEVSRLDTLHSLHILDTLPEERFDRLTRLAKRLFSVPTALISFIDGDRHWTKSNAGPAAKEVPRNVSFCGHAILEENIMVVPDTFADARFHDNPQVTRPNGVRFYAGCPLRAQNGSALGVLCLLDVRSRDLDDEERALLRDLAHIVEQEISSIQLATMDDLTKLYNRRGFEILAQHALQFARRTEMQTTLLFFDLDGFKTINDTHGHAEGDHVLKAFANALRGTLRGSDVVGRLGGDEFVALLPDSGGIDVQEFLQRLQTAIAQINVGNNLAYSIGYSVGHVEYDSVRHLSIAQLLGEADAAMYVNKQSRKSLRG